MRTRCFLMRFWCVLLFCGIGCRLLSLPLLGVVSEDEVREALGRLSGGALADWSYQADYMGEEESRRLQFGVGQPGQREVRLISVERRAPDAEELSEFEEAQQKNKSGDGDDFALGDLITEGSLKYVREDADVSHFRFTPRFSIEGDPEPQEALLGELVFDRTGGYVRELEVRSEGVFKPRFGVKLSKLRFGFRFQLLADGTPAPETMITEIKGRAFLVANFDESMEVRYHTYKKETSGDPLGE